jgi:hypothetical protein
MRLELLTSLTQEKGPFVTVCHDVSRLDTQASHEVELRWEGAVRELTAQGAPPETLEVVGERALAPSGRSGRVGRFIIGSGDRVLLDIVLPDAPLRDQARYGTVPDLMPLFRWLCTSTRYAVVRLDRMGADVEVVGLFGEKAQEESVQGTEDIVHKFGGGGWAHRRFQQRIEDSWQRNASQVAHQLESIVRRQRPQLVLVLGDQQAISALTGSASHELGERLVRLDTGGRAEGTSAELEQKAIEEAVAAHVRQHKQDLLERYAAALAKQEEGLDGIAAVVDSLRRGQVDELIIHDHPGAEGLLWVGEEPLQIGTVREDAVTAGASDPQQQPAAEVLLWATLGSGGGITVLADDDEVPVELTDGVGALLRWSDPSTPHSGAPSMPGHGEGPGNTGP